MQQAVVGNFRLIAFLVVLLLLAGMFLLVEAGFRIGNRHRARAARKERGETGRV